MGIFCYHLYCTFDATSAIAGCHISRSAWAWFRTDTGSSLNAQAVGNRARRSRVIS
jgi:hypothetical protein